MSTMKPHTSRDPREVMNLALDQELNPETRAFLNTHFERTPADAHRWQRLQRVDRMLRAAPITGAPAGFAERVMTALCAGLARLLAARTPEITYRIPVQVLS